MAEASGSSGGIVIPMTMSGDGFVEAIYSVPLSVGASGSSFMMQVDCGSSDLWLASTSCKSSACQRAGTGLYGWSSTTVDSTTVAGFNYLSGYIQGSIVWDNIQLGGYNLTNQALCEFRLETSIVPVADNKIHAVSAVEVDDEQLSSHFAGLIGLALERNSVIAHKADDEGLQLPATTFSTNIFTGATPPTSRIIGVSLERPGQANSGTPSLLSIGRHPASLVPDPSKISYAPLNGNTYWRVQVTQISAGIPGDWSGSLSSSKRGLEPRGAYGPGSNHNLVLGSSQVAGARSIWPLAILDTGGARIITSRSLANAFWGAYGVGPASDGMYYVSCQKPLNVSIQIGGTDYAIHPLDMSYIASSDPNSGNCIGAWQASDALSSADLVLGAAFMRNVYTVLQYDTPITGATQAKYDPYNSRPQLGLMSLTKWEVALQDFYRVRVLGQPLEIPSTSSPSSGSSGGGTSSGANSGTVEKDKKMTVGVMALIGVMAFFGVAAGLFGLRWWMMKRRWRRMRAAATQDAEKKGEDSTGGVAIPRPPRLGEDEAFERGHSRAYTRDSSMWDVDASTIVGSRSSRATDMKGRRKHHKINSRVGVMGEWVEPDSDEEGEEAGWRGSVAGSGSAKGSLGGGAESWAAVRPRQIGDLDVLERANRTLSFAGVGAGENIRFIGVDSEFGRPLSMPVDISQMPGSSTRAYHRATYSRADSDGVRAPLLTEGVRSPLGKASFALEELEMPRIGVVPSQPSVDELAQARPSVDVGLGEEKDGGTGPDAATSPRRNSSGNEMPTNRESIDITSPRSYRPAVSMA
ncbi:hypothetical protein FRC10_002324 [Ceratobasidium sp. 414]|nr:hypothetical protein FRC10_002324 [Ceratobasidium sp. 414]